MKEFLQNLFKTAEERVKNPFIGAFMMAWVIINWRTWVFLVFSNKSIEDRIIHINTNYTDLFHLLYLPLAYAAFYVLLLPVINLGIDWVLEFPAKIRDARSLKRQNATLQSRIEISLNEIKLEEAKTQYRERHNHNRMVEELQARIASYEQQVVQEKEKYELVKSEMQGQLKNIESVLDEERTNFFVRDSARQTEIKEIQERANKQTETNRYLLEEASDLKRKILSQEADIEEKNAEISYQKDALKDRDMMISKLRDTDLDTFSKVSMEAAAAMLIPPLNSSDGPLLA